LGQRTPGHRAGRSVFSAPCRVETRDDSAWRGSVACDPRARCRAPAGNRAAGRHRGRRGSHAFAERDVVSRGLRPAEGGHTLGDVEHDAGGRTAQLLLRVRARFFPLLIRLRSRVRSRSHPGFGPGFNPGFGFQMARSRGREARLRIRCSIGGGTWRRKPMAAAPRLSGRSIPAAGDVMHPQIPAVHRMDENSTAG